MSQYCRDKARQELNLILAGGVAAGIAPLPGAMTLGLTALQTAVVYRIARIYDYQVEAAGGAAVLVAAILARSGAAFAVGRVAGEAATFVPLVGWVIKPVIGAGTTKAFGEAAIAFFEKLSPDKVFNDRSRT